MLNTRPSLPLAAYVGSYTDPLYGKADVTLRDGKLYFSLNNVMTGFLDHWNFDTFRAQWDAKWRGTSPLSFELDSNGRIAGLKLMGGTFKRTENQ